MSDVREALERIAQYPMTRDQELSAQSMRDIARAALQSQTAPAVPEGWVLVPVEPTKRMITSAMHECTAVLHEYAGHDAWCKTAYRTMLDAAPQPDHSPDAGKMECHAPGDRCRACPHYFGKSDRCDYAISPCTAVDAGKVVPVGWIWDAYGQRNFTAGTHHKNVLEADGLTLIPVYTHPAQPRNEVQGEPVAWAVFADNGNLRIWGREKPKSFPDAFPLYLRPTVKDSLTAESLAQLDSEDQKGMERIVEAVAHIGIDFGHGTYELEQCHIDRAREIKESLARLRASQQEGGDA